MAEQLLVESLNTITGQVISQMCICAAHLANLLPTGTVIVFQLLTPILTNQGQCDYVNRSMTTLLIALCAISGFILTFTDSFTDDEGVVHYGFATLSGLWVINGSTNSPTLPMETYRLKFIDFFHAFLSLLMFAAVALCDANTVACFYPFSYTEAKEIIISLPMTIGIFACIMFVIFPTDRHGIGFPVSESSSQMIVS